MPIKVPQKVLNGLNFVRKSGRTNMLDYHAVQGIAYDHNYYETVMWLEDNKNKYSRGIFEGFEVG